MSGLLRRIRRPGAAEETRTEPIALPDPAHGSAPSSPADGADGQRLPAGVGPEDLERRSATGRRSKLRRRARFLRRARELALRDLGGLVYEARRREQDGGKLVAEKAERLAAIDAELHELDAVLGTPRGETVLREPGVGGTCPRCGELHASDAKFCARCGVNLAEAEAEAEAKAAADAAAAKAPAPEAADAPAPDAAEEPAPEAANEPAPEAANEPAPDAAEEPAPPETASERSGNGRVDGAEAPTEAAEPATTPDRPA